MVAEPVVDLDVNLVQPALIQTKPRSANRLEKQQNLTIAGKIAIVALIVAVALAVIKM